jgi:ribosomal protein S18 acetylase RimI-like enzyme
MIIRTADKTEWQSLQDLNNEVFIDNAKYDPDIVTSWAYSEEGKKYFQDLVIDFNSICFVAVDNNKLVGYLAASPKPISYRKSRYLEVDNMGVIPEYKGQGIGKLLMMRCKEWAKEMGYQKIFVNAYSKNETAIKFYERCGFHVIDISLELSI